MDASARTSFLIRRLQSDLGNLIEQELRKLELTNGQYTVLSTIAKRSGSSSADIARRLRVKPQALNEFIPPLEQRGLITRRGHPDNRRILCVYTTPAGQNLLERCNEAVDRLEAEFFSILSGGELETLRGLCMKLVENASRFDFVNDRPRDGAAAGDGPMQPARGFE